MSKIVLLYLLLVVAVMYAADITDEDEKMLRNAFRIMDHNHEDSLDKLVFVNIVERIKRYFDFLKDGETEANNIDVNSDDRIDVDEFLNWCGKFIDRKGSDSTEELLRKMFNNISMDEGSIKNSILAGFWRRIDFDISKEKAEEIIGGFDTDESGTINLEEFMNALTK